MTFIEYTKSIAVAGLVGARGGVGSGNRGQNRMALPRATGYHRHPSSAVSPVLSNFGPRGWRYCAR